MVKVKEMNAGIDGCGGIHTVTPLQPGYPRLLHLIPDPPPLLYYTGDLSLASGLCAAVVGARKATEYGRWVALQLGRRLAEHGVTVVSGMAAGVDTAGHRGALGAGGKTIAVLGCGLDVCYPRSNRRLKAEIEGSGLILSEYPPGSQPLPYAFPARNRIISGLCPLTVVVEAGPRSGSLITAERAAEQGREIYAVPGNITSPGSMGANRLIADGAVPLVVIDDILDGLGLSRVDTELVKSRLAVDEREVYAQVEKGGEVTVDQIARRLEKPVEIVAGIVTVLEMKGAVYDSLGKIFLVK